MLRHLLLALFAVNLLYFAWAHWVDAPAAPQEAENVAAATSAPASGAVSPAAATGATQGANTAAVVAPQPADAVPEAAAGPAACTSLGPFANAATAERTATLLAAAGKPSRARAATQPVADGYWVYVGGIKDAAAQRRTLTAIKRSGIDDSFAMPDDPQFRVSVGIFSERDRAEQRARRVRLLDLDPRVEEHFRMLATQWLDFDLAPAALQPAQLGPIGITDPALTTAACP